MSCFEVAANCLRFADLIVFVFGLRMSQLSSERFDLSDLELSQTIPETQVPGSDGKSLDVTHVDESPLGKPSTMQMSQELLDISFSDLDCTPEHLGTLHNPIELSSTSDIDSQQSTTTTTQAESHQRRSKRLQQKKNDVNNDIEDLMQSRFAPSTSKGFKRKQSKDAGQCDKVHELSRDTFFEKGHKAVAIIGSTSINDEESGGNLICYLVKFDNAQFELVENKVAHKFCPQVSVQHFLVLCLMQSISVDHRLPRGAHQL